MPYQQYHPISIHFLHMLKQQGMPQNEISHHGQSHMDARRGHPPKFLKNSLRFWKKKKFGPSKFFKKHPHVIENLNFLTFNLFKFFENIVLQLKFSSSIMSPTSTFKHNADGKIPSKYGSRKWKLSGKKNEKLKIKKKIASCISDYKVKTLPSADSGFSSNPRAVSKFFSIFFMLSLSFVTAPARSGKFPNHAILQPGTKKSLDLNSRSSVQTHQKP